MSHTSDAFKNLGKGLVNVGKSIFNIFTSIGDDIREERALKKEFIAFKEAKLKEAQPSTEADTRARDEA